MPDVTEETTDSTLTEHRNAETITQTCRDPNYMPSVPQQTQSTCPNRKVSHIASYAPHFVEYTANYLFFRGTFEVNVSFRKSTSDE